MTTDPLVRLAVVWILLFGFFARAQTVKIPLFDHHSWRQADTAQIARNFWRERFNPAFPQVDQRGAQADGSVETGFELYALFVAAIARVAGFHVEIGRLLNSLLFLGSGALVFRFLSRRYDVIVGLIGLFVYAFGLPMSLFLDRAFMNEGLLMLLSFSCFVAAQSYLARPRWQPVAVLVVASALIGMIKFPYLIVWAPVAGLFWEAGTPRVARFRPLYLMAAVDLAAAALWYSHAHRLGLATGLSFGLLDKTFDPALVLSGRFVLGMSLRLFRDVLGPLGFIAAAAGLVICMKRRRWAEVFGAAAFCAYLVLVARGNDVHDYYQVAIVPIGVALIAVGVGEGLKMAGVSERRYRSIVVAVLALMASTTFLRSISAHSWYEYDASRLEMCRQLRAQLEPGELLAFVDDPNPDLLFCVDRRGWLFQPGQGSSVQLSNAWRDGARVLVVPRPEAMLSISEEMRPRGAPIARAGELAAYRLEPFPGR
jgi:hypothetical protein